MVAGVALGLSAPGLMQGLRSLEFGAGSQINVPIAILIWLLIFAFQADNITTKTLHVALIAVPTRSLERVTSSSLRSPRPSRSSALSPALRSPRSWGC
jgi:ACR3 family arsenite efflux pump ArsB